MAAQWNGVQTGETVELRCDIAIDNDASKPIYMLNSTMYMLMDNGGDTSASPGSNASLYTKYDPKTFPVVSPDRKKVWLVEIDGRQIPSGAWYSLGVKGYEIYRIGLVSRPSDSRGERSDMTYILIREK